MGRQRLISFNGHERTLSGWARELGLSKQLIHIRLKHGWPLSEVLSSTFRDAGRRGYGAALSDIQRDALTVLRHAEEPLAPSEFLPDYFTNNQRDYHCRMLTKRGLIERIFYAQYRITEPGREALMHDPRERHFMGAKRAKR